jgi:hypothetical protein
MPKKNQLPSALKRAREMRGWSIYEASQRLGFSSTNALRTLEGLNPDRDPGGPNCKLKTVLDIIRVYWPDVDLQDFMDEPILVKATARDPKSLRRLKGFLAKTG